MVTSRYYMNTFFKVIKQRQDNLNGLLKQKTIYDALLKECINKNNLSRAQKQAITIANLIKSPKNNNDLSRMLFKVQKSYSLMSNYTTEYRELFNFSNANESFIHRIRNIFAHRKWDEHIILRDVENFINKKLNADAIKKFNLKEYLNLYAIGFQELKTIIDAQYELLINTNVKGVDIEYFRKYLELTQGQDIVIQKLQSYDQQSIVYLTELTAIIEDIKKLSANARDLENVRDDKLTLQENINNINYNIEHQKDDTIISTIVAGGFIFGPFGAIVGMVLGDREGLGYVAGLLLVPLLASISILDMTFKKARAEKKIQRLTDLETETEGMYLGLYKIIS